MNPDFELIDTHAHLYLPEFDDDREAMMDRALQQGVKKIYLPNIDTASVEKMLDMEAAYPDICYPMIGLHPCSVTSDFQKDMDILESWLDRHAFSAIGEVGTDLYWDKTYSAQQVTCLETQISWAKERNLPIVLHSRESLDLNIEIVTRFQDGSLRGVFHCFTGTEEQAKRIIDLGFYLGIGGVITFKNSGVAEIVASLPLESLVLETDAPYLAPHPYRGQRNESSYIRLIAERVAVCKAKSLSTVCQATSQNALKLFAPSMV
ncbi:MAG TPA: TatD family hydrolase [Saprospiraceae bacterium]|nr:TatD family hydrolase [Saprospiraceae bacterium]